MFKEFKEFAMRGNVVDLAVGVVIGAAFGKIVTSFVPLMRVAVPLMVRDPGAAAETNATAAVMVDVPLDGRPFELDSPRLVLVAGEPGDALGLPVEEPDPGVAVEADDQRVLVGTVQRVARLEGDDALPALLRE